MTCQNIIQTKLYQLVLFQILLKTTISTSDLPIVMLEQIKRNVHYIFHDLLVGPKIFWLKVEITDLLPLAR